MPRKMVSVSLTMVAKLMLADISLLPDARCQLHKSGARIKSYIVSPAPSECRLKLQLPDSTQNPSIPIRNIQCPKQIRCPQGCSTGLELLLVLFTDACQLAEDGRRESDRSFFEQHRGGHGRKKIRAAQGRRRKEPDD